MYMKPLNIEIIDIKYRRPNLCNILFVASYNGYWRRGSITYDNKNMIFMSHNKDIDLLTSVITNIRMRHNTNYK